MEFITGKHISRRTVLRGLGATVALPFLDAMVPARKLWAKTAAAIDRTRLVCIEMVHGAAGSNEWGASQNLWSPATVGRDFDLGPGSLSPLEPFRDYLTIVSNTDVRMAEAFEPTEIGGDHFRSSATFLTQAHPKQTEGSTSMWGRRWTSFTPNGSARTRPSRQCSSASRTSTSRADALTATPVCTPTRSAGRRPPSRFP